MFGKKKTEPINDQPQEKPIPAFLRDDYPYKAIGEAITDLDTLESGALYEIKCPQCEMSIRSQGQNIKSTYDSLKEKGCIGCGNKDLIVKKVDVSAAPKKSEN